MNPPNLKNFKVSIKVSIITLFVLLISVVGMLIISINHFTLDRILLKTSQNLIDQTSALIKNRLQLYLRPLDHDLLETQALIANGVIDPTDRRQFNYFLYEFVKNNPNVYGVYWANPAGDFIGIDRETDGKLALQHIIRSQTPPFNIRYALDGQGQTLDAAVQNNMDYDPRTRPWYQAAAEQGKLIWTDIYQFHLFAGNDYELPGITAAAPVYNNQHQLLGIFGLDLTINQLSQFIKNLKISDNSIIYVTDHDNKLVAFHRENDNTSVIGKQVDDKLIKALHIPVPATGLPQTNNSIIDYKFDGQYYFASYQVIEHQAGHDWRIAIIVPANDILNPLKQASLQALLLTIASLLIAVLVVRYISQRISKPIMQLADEARAITRLDLTKRIELRSIIKEISYMNDAFGTMRSSLESFQRYVPSTLVKSLINSGQIAKVGGNNTELTFLFSDIKNFTQLAEKTNPERLMQFLSEYFEAMTQAVIGHSGTLDKYIGDAIMAFWNAPTPDESHALHACRSALAMLEKLVELNQSWKQTGLPSLNIRIGINTGHAIVGNVGSEDRLSYTAIGDSVNLGSRLEAINKVYGTHILVSEFTYEQVKTQFNFRFIDKITVRGKEKVVAIYELISTPFENLAAYQQQFDVAFALYQQGDWEQSISLFKDLAAAYPQDNVATVFVKRCEQLITEPPTQWTGVWRMDK